VRGFRENTLGPLDSKQRPFGGNLKVIGNAEVILPVPFTKNIRSFRVSSFVDVGNVYGVDEDFTVSELRYSAGLSAIWLSPLGVLSFSLAKPLNSKEGDQIQMFQFTIGTTF
jgi:outer membrane protein insertion porin family